VVELASNTVTSAMTASRDASVVTVLGESVMNDMTDTTEGSEVSRVSRDGCDSPPVARPVPRISVLAIVAGPLRTRHARARARTRQ
jgi:hypothetical protein